MHKRGLFLVQAAGLAALFLIVTAPAHAADIDFTAFGGVQHQGHLTVESAGTAIRTINATNFGVFGGRIGHGGVFGGEHTIAYAPNFIDTQNQAFIYNSNILVQAPFPVVKPYGTAGLGLVHTWGDALTVFGTKFAINYGGGVKFLPAGPVGIRLDVRGYTIPSTEFKVFAPESQNLNVLEASVGVIFRFSR
jgi:hypothetical protein